MVSFQRKRLWLQNFDSLQLLVEKFTINNMGAPHKHGILELRENYAWDVNLIPHNATKELCIIMKSNSLTLCTS